VLAVVEAVLVQLVALAVRELLELVVLVERVQHQALQAHLLPMRVAVVVLRELELQVLVALEVVALVEETLPISMVVLELQT
jgi:hypothetical protein